MLVFTEPGYAQPVAKAAPAALSPANPEAVGVSVVAQLAALQQSVTDDLTRLLTVISLVALTLTALTAGVSIFPTVVARAAHIALQRALGSSQASIWRLDTMEGGFTGLVGAGVGVGTLLVFALTRAYGLTPHLGIGAVLHGPTASAVTGVIASAYPRGWH